MAIQPLTTTVSEFASWFDDTRYAIRAMQDDMKKDPIFSLLGEDTSSNRSSVLSTTGIDYNQFAKAQVPGQSLARNAPVEADQHSVYYITFSHRFDYERPAILHDQYSILDPDGTACLKAVWDAVGLFLTNCFWNYNTSSSIDVPSQLGVVNYAITCPDGQPIVSASRSGPGYSSKTNIGGTAKFSGSAVVSNIDVGHQNRKTPAGRARPYDANCLFLGRNAALREAMLQYTGSQKVYSSANNAVTVFQGGSMDVFEFKWAPFTTTGDFDTTASKLHKWATGNKEEIRRGFKYKWIEQPTVVEGPKIDTDNLDTFRIATCRIAFMPEDPWGLIQNNASEAPVTAF